jgi:hypothetical protein
LPGHIFDTNVLKNFLLTHLVGLIPKLCPGNLYLPAAVRAELQTMKAEFPRVRASRAGTLTTADLVYVQQLDQHRSTLGKHGFAPLNILGSVEPTELDFWACVDALDRIDPGETEGLALAAYRGLTLYSDDQAVVRIAELLANEELGCPPYGTEALPFPRVEVHSSIYLLLRAVEQGLLSENLAERYYREMRNDIGSRLPRMPLAQIRQSPARYW